MSYKLPPPSKIKEVLGRIKETLLDHDEDETNGGRGGNNHQAKDPSKILPLYLALMRLELLQRGVFVFPKEEEEAENKDSDQNQQMILSNLLTVVQSTAGKALVTPSGGATMPAPLLAGSSVLQGRLAEQMAHQLAYAVVVANDGPLSAPSVTFRLQHVVPHSTWDTTLRRCQEVSDERLALLLQLALEEATSTTETQLQFVLLFVAEGCYYRAAEFSPDAPPLWKRASDAIQQRQHYSQSSSPSSYTWESQWALDNMHRIAAAKNNTKRVAQLSLALAQSMLEGYYQDLFLHQAEKASLSSSSEGVSTPLTKRVQQAFVAPYRSVQPPTLAQACQLARDYLHDTSLSPTTSPGNLSPADAFWNLVLHVQLFFVQEENRIEQVARERLTAERNRVVEGKRSSAVSSVPSLTTMKCRIRHEHLEQEDLISGESDALVTSLRDALISIGAGKAKASASSSSSSSAPSDSDVPDSLMRSAQELLTRVLVRFKDRAKACNQKSQSNSSTQQLPPKGAGYDKREKTANDFDRIHIMWQAIANFVRPLVRMYQQEFDWKVEMASDVLDQKLSVSSLIHSMPSEWNNLAKEIVLSMSCMEWIVPDTVSSAEMYFTKELLQMYHHIEQQQHVIVEQEKQAAGAVLSSVRDAKATELLRLQCAWRSATAQLYLMETETGNETSIIRSITDLAVSRSNQDERALELDAEFGVSFLECIVCWSGLHSSPWQFCIMSEARFLISQAKNCLLQAKLKWGRQENVSDLWLLDLARADAEGSFASSGGLVRDALQLYTAVLQSSENYVNDESYDGQVVALMIQARCFSGLATVALQSDESKLIKGASESAEELIGEQRAFQYLKVIELIQSSRLQQLPLLPWKKSQATVESLSFQLASARQLIADALLRRGNTDEAQAFLEAASRESPNDAKVALSLGAFRLRIMFFGSEGPTQDISKTAQVQLLRAAKMDSNQASPFALLGYWYEYFKDLKRAAGCYSKALLLDPAHPVAGRGLLRLRPTESLVNILENATTSTSSSVNGWAWKAIGFHKAYSDGDDHLASLSLLKALRCRDIEYPRSEALSMFYFDPSRPCLANKQEMADALSELAATYRRQGRYTAALRTYNSAIEKSGESASAHVLCSCAEGKLCLVISLDAR